MKVVIAIDSFKGSLSSLQLEQRPPPGFIVSIRRWRRLCARLPMAVKVPFSTDRGPERIGR